MDRATNVAFSVELIVFVAHEWTIPFSASRFAVGENVDIDIWQYLSQGFDGIVTRKPGTDQFPADLSIVDSRYLRGEVTETFEMRTIRLIATQYNLMVESGDWVMKTDTNALWTDGERNALWTDGSGNALWTGAIE